VPRHTIKSGDLLAFSSPTPLGRAIQIATLGRYNHVGIVGPSPSDDGVLLYESTTDATHPCVIRRVRVVGVQVQWVNWRIRTATDAGCWVYHVPLLLPLTYNERRRLGAFLRGKLGTPYDFAGAWRARTLGLGWCRWLLPNREDTGDLFCSELTALALRHVKRFNTKNCSAWSPSAFVRALVHRGIAERPRLLGRDGG